ncbi:MAG: hypothetical protein JRJ58_08915 [Deltaproteobacteria bacterium]|nr:hypothetical protein [Deltaproteobacteria bacterium]
MSVEFDLAIGKAARTDRQLTTAALGALVALGLLTGCAPEPDEAGSDGILRYGVDLVQTVGDLPMDPVASRIESHLFYLTPLYDTLLRHTPNGFEPRLASDWEIVDPQTLELRLREGVEFHDGHVLDARVVKASILRALASKNANFQPAFFELERVEILGPLELRLHLRSQIAGEFLTALAGRETMPVSPGALTDETGRFLAPAGAGPYRLHHFAPERRLSLRKNPDHWDAARVRLSGIDFLQTPVGPQRVNALRTGRIDLTQDLTNREAEAIEGLGGFEIYPISSDGFFHYLGFYKDRPPLDDVRVRRALGYALDRKAISWALFGENGEPAYQPWPRASPNHDPSLGDAYAYDPARARALLAEAGYPDGFGLRLMTAGSSDLIRASEIVHQNLREVGIELEVIQSSAIVDEFFRARRTELTLVSWTRSGLQKITRMFGPHSVANIGHVSLPPLDRLTAQLGAMAPGDPSTTPLWHSIAQIVADQALVHYLVFGSNYFAVNAQRVAGFSRDQIMPFQLGVPVFDRLSIRD